MDDKFRQFCKVSVFKTELLKSLSKAIIFVLILSILLQII